jgi:chemotaxis regulatin CheY-phosphate phosphatase CheZ
MQELETLAAGLAPPPLPDFTRPAGPAPAADNEEEARMLEELNRSVRDIFSNVNGIVEALSFQDLSGQVIYKTVKLLTDFQVRLLAMVVSFGSKIKTKSEAPGEVTSTAQTEKTAQDEVDKALAAVGAKETEGGNLNQNSVNSLLDSLGF